MKRDKNKELEARNKELDRKLREEKVLREKAESRNVDFRRKLKEAKEEGGTGGTPATLKFSEDVSIDDKEAARNRADSVAEQSISRSSSQGNKDKSVHTSSVTPTKPKQLLLKKR